MVIKTPVMRYPRVNLSVILLKEDKVLLGKMKCKGDNILWKFPESYLKYYEYFMPFAAKTLMYQTGLSKKCFEIIDKEPCAVTNDMIIEQNNHFITLYLRAKYKIGNIEVKNPDKCEGWEWFYWNELPKDSGVSIRNLLKQGYDPFN